MNTILAPFVALALAIAIILAVAGTVHAKPCGRGHISDAKTCHR